MAVAGDGSVYVAGRSRSAAGDWDFATVKYDPHGVSLWERRFDGPGHHDDEPVGIGGDAQGNVYVGGFSRTAEDDFVVTVVKYAASGIQQWTAQQGTRGVDYVATAMVVDAAGNTTLTGYQGVRGQRRDFLTTRFDAGGQQAWTQQYNGPGSEDDAAFAIAEDASGNTYVTGYSQNTEGATLYYSDWPTIKYTPSGQKAWVARFENPVRRFAEGISVQADSSGNVYVSGTIEEPTHHNEQAALLKLDSAGNLAWQRVYGGTVQTSGGLVAVDEAGNTFQEIAQVSALPTLLSYDRAGNARWTAAVSGVTDGYSGHALMVDTQGVVYRAFTYAAPPDYRSAFLLTAYGADGATLWSSTVRDPRYASYQLAGMALDGTGNLYLTSTASVVSSTNQVVEDWYTLKLGGPASGVRGRVQREDGTPLAGVLVQVADRSVVTGFDGSYFVAELPPGSYTVTPSLAGYQFAPPSASIVVGPGDGQADFVARPITYSISGTIRAGGAPLAGVQVDLGFGPGAVTGADGSYVFSGLRGGSYTVTPLAPDHDFVPASRTVTVGPADASADFDGVRVSVSISGRVRTPAGVGVAGVTISAGSVTTATDAQGNYTLAGLARGFYTVTPTRAGATFSPGSAFVMLGPNATGVDFLADQTTFRISGTVRVTGAPLAGVTVKVGTRTVVTGSDGGYAADGLRPGHYTAQPTRKGVTFSPKSRRVVLGPDAAAVDFNGKKR